MIYCFANRRRAKDAIMLIAERFGVQGMMVFVREDMAYVILDGSSIPTTEADLIMHYATKLDVELSEVMSIDSMTEFYRGPGISKFKV